MYIIIGDHLQWMEKKMRWLHSVLWCLTDLYTYMYTHAAHRKMLFVTLTWVSSCSSLTDMTYATALLMSTCKHQTNLVICTNNFVAQLQGKLSQIAHWRHPLRLTQVSKIGSTENIQQLRQYFKFSAEICFNYPFTLFSGLLTFSNDSFSNAFFHSSRNCPWKLSFTKTPTVLP